MGNCASKKDLVPARSQHIRGGRVSTTATTMTSKTNSDNANNNSQVTITNSDITNNTNNTNTTKNTKNTNNTKKSTFTNNTNNTNNTKNTNNTNDTKITDNVANTNNNKFHENKSAENMDNNKDATIINGNVNSFNHQTDNLQSLTPAERMSMFEKASLNAAINFNTIKKRFELPSLHDFSVNEKNNNETTKPVKVLLLGSGESGKTTMLKQIKIIHQTGFSKMEKMEYKPFVFENVCESAVCIIDALKQYDLMSDLTVISEDDLNVLLNYHVPTNNITFPFNPMIAELIKKMLSDPVVKKLLSEDNYGFYILDSAKYFFENLDRIKETNYLPSVDDIIRTRKQTSGIFDTKFNIAGLDIHLFDVGGQRSERKKWIHCFDNVTAIVFCVSLSEYDETLLEDPTQNRLEESFLLFDSVVNSMWFRRCAVILCLNKIDRLVAKLPYSPLQKYFPDYVGGADVNNVIRYILWRLKLLNRANLTVIPCVTDATSTDDIRGAFAIVRETILYNNLLDSGIINS